MRLREDGATISFIRKENESVIDFATFYRADTEITSEDGEVVKGKRSSGLSQSSNRFSLRNLLSSIDNY